MNLPAPSTWTTFEALLTAYNVLSDPSTVKVTRLCRRLFVIDITRVHHARIKRHEILDRLEFFCRIGVVPHRILSGLFTDLEGVVGTISFPLAECVAISWDEKLFLNIIRRDVIHWRVTCFEHSVSFLSICHRLAIKYDSESKLFDTFSKAGGRG
jgi:hypothetical protein